MSDVWQQVWLFLCGWKGREMEKGRKEGENKGREEERKGKGTEG